MSLVEEIRYPWTRKHDDPRIPHIPEAPRVVYPGSLEELIAVCREGSEPLRAAGSHWGLSAAAISDHTFIETNDPLGLHPTLSRTLHDVVPECLSYDYLKLMAKHASKGDRWYLLHFEAGKRICQLYAELDQPTDPDDPQTLAGRLKAEFGDASFTGPWGCATLGGAAGQTFVGAFSTGTHGGDFDRPPTPDSVVALHIVAAGGRQFWLEDAFPSAPPLVDDARLQARYPGITILRDHDLFRAALVSVGRLGVIYSVVVKAVPQYCLLERVRLNLWENVKETIRDRPDALFNAPALLPEMVPGSELHNAALAAGQQHFLQIAVCLIPLKDGARHQVGITQRWSLPVTPEPPGRKERVGAVLEPGLRGGRDPVFENVGRGIGFKLDPADPMKGAEPGLLENACENASFLVGVIKGVVKEIEEFVESNGAVLGAGMAAVAGMGGVGLLSLLPAFALIVAVLLALLELFDDDTRFGEVMNEVKEGLIDHEGATPESRAAGVFAWRMIYNEVFKTQQKECDYFAVSYAVLDKHHYGNRCEVNVDSVEVFFDAADSRLVAFMDAVLAFEERQEFHGRSTLGYASLRFTGPTEALIGMERFERTCVVEIACLRDMTGGQELLDYAVQLARHPSINGILHWGQRNDCTREEIDLRFGPESGEDRIGAWRRALARLTEDGRSDRFSSAFSRQVGLEL